MKQDFRVWTRTLGDMASGHRVNYQDHLGADGANIANGKDNCPCLRIFWQDKKTVYIPMSEVVQWEAVVVEGNDESC